MTIEPAALTVNPGSEVTTTVTVRNLGTRVEEFQLMPRGPAAAFAAITPPTLSIYPDDEQHAVVRFAPPRDPQSPADVAPFDIMARSAIHTDVSDVARGELTVTPFHELRAVLTPEISRGRKPARHQVSVTNGGNTPVDTQLAFRDQDGELTFKPPGGAATLRPGATADFPVRINGPHRWFGRTTRLPFSAVVTPADPQPPITLHGTRQQTAMFPWWIPTAAVAIVAIAIALFALLKPGTPTVPVIGPVDETTAVQRLTNAQYIPDVIKAGDDLVPAGLATRTDPAGGMPLPRGEHVKLYISTGKCPDGPCPVEVPNVEGLPIGEAQAKLQSRKFVVRSYRVPSDLPTDQVITSAPKAATLHPPGTEVALTVSSGPQRSSSSPDPLSLGPPGPRPQDPPPGLPVPLPGLPVQLPGLPVQLPPSNPLPQTPAPSTPTPPPPTPPPPTPPPPTPPPPARTCPPTSLADQPTTDGVEIAAPGSGARIKGMNEGHGTARLKPGEHLWLLLCAPGVNRFYFVTDGHREVPVSNNTWHAQFYVSIDWPGKYLLYAVVVNTEDSQRLDQTRINGGESPYVSELPQSARYFSVAVQCCG